ncbi:PRC-barrel domain-containing protein [Sagittula salina]|uniref:PRC-barrel domain-containing protein n=1 Tax=Sagittula salina TaxID=2820268 RepID=A0A940MLN4_9RHOB|nr:PRC-barrel domain-containing protein [Sagittula salina]MBP0481858.1 PRC-barrel domain-containing protein [Sagittula salina]
MKRILMTTALAALMPMAALAQSSDTSADADAKLKLQQAEQAQAGESDTSATEDSTMAAEADATANADAEMSGEADSTMTAEGDAATTGDATMQATDGTLATDGTDEQIAGGVNDTAMTGEQMGMDTASMAGEDLGIAGEASANSIIGSRLYVIRGDNAGEWDATATYDQVGDGWERAGSVQDIVIGQDGKIDGIVAEVGGFLGIGDKYVLLELGQAKLVPLDGGGFDVVTHYSNEELTDMDAFDTAALQ